MKIYKLTESLNKLCQNKDSRKEIWNYIHNIAN